MSQTVPGVTQKAAGLPWKAPLTERAFRLGPGGSRGLSSIRMTLAMSNHFQTSIASGFGAGDLVFP